MTNRQQFRRLLREPGIQLQPVVYDPMGARIAEDVGFSMIALGGFAVGAHLAVTEPLSSLDDFARITRSIRLVCKLPIMVDAGAGYGDPLHVMHTVRVLEQAGASAMRRYLTTLKNTGESGLDAEEAVKVRQNLERTIGLDDLYRLEERDGGQG